MAFQLSPVEVRILGCLLEKERLTPENYPLSLHSLTAACNQSTSREPVVNYDERTVEEALFSLRQKKLATLIMCAGARVQKFRHHLLDHFELNPGEVGLLCVLLLRGPQTPGELRSRTERFHAFAGVPQLEECLQGLAAGTEPLVRMMAPRPGQKERRFVQLLAGEPVETVEAVPGPVGGSDPVALAGPTPSRVDSLEAELKRLQGELAALREEFTAFKRQFE